VRSRLSSFTVRVGIIFPRMIHLPTDLLRDRDALTAREWIVSNGLGAYASGT
jgi:hypothetical protein